MIPNAKPSIGAEELSEVAKVFASGWLGLGSEVFEFEKSLKVFLGARNVIAVNSGTSALHIALDALGIGAGDEVIVPAMTFAATPQAILACRAVPVFCDIDETTLNMDLTDVKRRLTARTKAILPVHYGGLACDMDGLAALARDRGLKIVEDAAHAFGSSYKGRKIGGFGDVVCFSFDPIKTITCGEGGAVSTANDSLAQEITRKRILGIDKDTWHRYRNERSWLYEVVTPGFRYHMSNVNAAIGLMQLKKAAAFIKSRQEIVRRYDSAFRGLAGVELLRREYDETAPFNYVIKIKDGRRDGLIQFLAEEGVGAGLHYIPNHIQPLFKPHKADLPATDRAFKEILSLPLYSSLTEKDVDTVIEKVRDYFAAI